ncbi:sterile alpha motif domain-containing protein 9 [Lepisosteus oculatus]|uniref:sterile alpha motif domain-containing protein 9 n=1 Tax=Lepisosteus oculatus TaxID=7918 RepID=UPI0035F52366
MAEQTTETLEMANCVEHLDSHCKDITALETAVKDVTPCLEILCPEQYERSDDTQKLSTAYFYKGGQAQWLNFLAETEEKSPFIKRDAYKSLMRLIEEHRQHHRSVSFVNLCHQPGSGGTTLAMQVLWDFKEELRCAVLKDTDAESEDIARQVTKLFNAGGEKNFKTVLLLADNLKHFEKQQQSFLHKIAEKAPSTTTPVVIVLNCKRDAHVKEAGHFGNCVNILAEVSCQEQDMLDEKLDVIKKQHKDHKTFYAFNVMQQNYSSEYIQGVVESVLEQEVLPYSRKTQLFSFLALMNTYSIGSSLQKSDCEAFLGPPDIYGGPPFEDRMKPLSAFLITFRKQEKLVECDHVRLVHHKIAAEFCEKLASKGWTRGKIMKNLLTTFKGKRQSLQEIIREMLQKRLPEARFSMLIESIHQEPGPKCVPILRKAASIFGKDAIISQVLARYYYLRKQNYLLAEKWAKEAKQIDPDNSFVADTLGQVYKKQLKQCGVVPVPQKLELLLELANKAVDAFREEQTLAESEKAEELENNGLRRESSIYNTSGLFGHIQVANKVFEVLTSVHPSEDMKKVLRREIEIRSLTEVDDRTVKILQQYRRLLSRLKDDVERIHEFADHYLTFSKPSILKDDPKHFQEDVSTCFSNYIAYDRVTMEEGCERLRKQLATGTAKINDQVCSTLLKIVWRWVNQIIPQEELKPTLRSLLESEARYKPAELYLLAFLSFWPPDDDKINLNSFVDETERSFQTQYSKYYRSRYIVPLFFLGKGTGVQRMIQKSKIDECLHCPRGQVNEKWRNGEVWRNTQVSALLERVSGVIKNREVFAVYNKKKIKVNPDNPAEVRKPCSITFFLGFNIKGPVAFDIQYVKAHVV